VEIWDKAAYEEYRNTALVEGIEGKLECLQISL
jgi:DNA-binding transcriptional regulator/RsmH inhibitor MraZ